MPKKYATSIASCLLPLRSAPSIADQVREWFNCSLTAALRPTRLQFTFLRSFMVRRSPGVSRLIEGVRDHTLDSALPCRYPEDANESRQLSVVRPNRDGKQAPQP